MCVRDDTRIYALYTYIHTYVHTYICTYIHTYIHTYVYTYMLACVHTHIRTYTHTNIQTYILTYVHTYVHTYMHTSICTYVRTYIHTYIACIYIFPHNMFNELLSRSLSLFLPSHSFSGSLSPSHNMFNVLHLHTTCVHIHLIYV